MRKELTQTRLKELVDYKNGLLIRKTTFKGHYKSGDIAGSLTSDGYLSVMLDGKVYLVHRLVFLYHHGYFPENGIDHIDRNKIHNAIENLREVTMQCNIRNAKQQLTTMSGIKGICKSRRFAKWQARIAVNGVSSYLGCFQCLTEAVAHRLAAEQALNWAGCDSNSPAFQYMQNYLQNCAKDAGEQS